MKCEKCGKSEVNFHYSSNVNGNITETHLCAQCAAESGYDIGQMIAQSQQIDRGLLVDLGQTVDLNQLLNLGSLLDSMFPVRGVSGFMPLAIPMIRTNQKLPFTVRPLTGKMEQDTPCVCGCGKAITKNAEDTKVDEEMNLRRELNAQMRAAVVKEEFEKAAELRDRIRDLEKNGLPGTTGAPGTIGTPGTERTQKCDSETTTQDSPTAQ